MTQSDYLAKELDSFNEVFSFMDLERPNTLENSVPFVTSCLQYIKLDFHELNITIVNGGKKKWTM